MEIRVVLSVIGALLFGGVAGFWGYKLTLTEKAKKFKEKMARAAEIEEKMLEEAREKAEKTVLRAEEKTQKILERAETKASEIEEKWAEKLEKIQGRLLEREEKLEEKLEKLEEQRATLKSQEEKLAAEILEQEEKLAEIAGMSPEQAKEKLLAEIEARSAADLEKFREKQAMILKEEADVEAAKILARAMPKIAGESSSEFTTILIDLPSEEFKGKLIGREGRNISFFEKLTGVELIIDDTPLVVRLSCFDHEKRFFAKLALEKLIKDGRINPFYIEKIYNAVVAERDQILLEKGKEALTMLGLPMMKPELMTMIGQFTLRYSYGQNLWFHSIEVARISEAIAVELGEDAELAKKAGLLHDVGKIQATSGESHTVVGGEILRKFGMDAVVINAAESHHFDVPMTHTISWIVTAADAMSASRPGARFNTRDLFIEKMGELEKTIGAVEGVDKVHVMQAGRDIMVFVDPGKVADSELDAVVQKIGENIENKLDYPGIIRISCIRESKLVQFLR